MDFDTKNRFIKFYFLFFKVRTNDIAVTENDYR